MWIDEFDPVAVKIHMVKRDALTADPTWFPDASREKLMSVLSQAHQLQR